MDIVRRALSADTSRLRPSVIASVCYGCCGNGHFLMALPDHVPATGIELDPAWAEEARRNSGREVITGDALSCDWGCTPTAI